MSNRIQTLNNSITKMGSQYSKYHIFGQQIILNRLELRYPNLILHFIVSKILL